PWEDAAVWLDRYGRAWQKNYEAVPSWKKPHCFTEFGLIYRKPGDSGFPDWTDAYNKDTTARHYRDALWAAIFRYIWMTHWKEVYIDGTFGGGGEKYWIFKPLRHFIEDEDLRGLTQETAYPGVTPVRLECTNTSKIQAMGLIGTDRSFVYVKNLTDCWYRIVNDPYHASPPPTPEDVSGTIRVYGLTPNQGYIIEKWSTTETIKANQIIETVWVPANASGTLEFNVSLPSLTAGAYDYAYKIYPAGTRGNQEPVADNQSVSTNEDMAKAITLSATDVDGDTLTYTILAGPLHGTLSGTAPNLIYTPAMNYNGLDSFTFKVSDGNADSNIAIISIVSKACYYISFEAEDMDNVPQATEYISDAWAGAYLKCGQAYNVCSHTFTAPEDGDYALCYRIGYLYDFPSESVTLNIDEGDDIVIYAHPDDGLLDFKWLNYQNGTRGDIIILSLTKGEHTLTINEGNSKAKLDSFIITNNLSYVPPATPPDITTSETVIGDGFGDTNNRTGKMASFNGNIYVSTTNMDNATGVKRPAIYRINDDGTYELVS
ncbi:MAG: Ig-like domain-containing protein, partial [Candidatus Omnitrophota bacterium]|nr:Ig-like domain-containing protein [Candidatus Omnitrophota bacterium]